MKQSIVILIAGTSGAGKGAMAEKISQKLGKNLALLQTDDFCRKETNDLTGLKFDVFDKFNKPENLKKDNLINDLKSLLDGKSIVVQAAFPKNPAEREYLVKPSNIIIVEGCHALQNEEIRNLADLKIYFDSDDDLKLIRRIRRSPYYREMVGSEPIDSRDTDLWAADPRNYGQSIIEAFDIWVNFHKSSEKKHIAPTKKYADLSFHNNTWKELDESAEKVVNFINLYFEDEKEFKKQLELIRIKGQELIASADKVEELEERISELVKKNKEIINEQQETKINDLQNIINQLETKNKKLEAQLIQLKIKSVREEFENSLARIKGKIGGEKEKKLLENLLEAQIEIVKIDSSFAKKQYTEIKNKLLAASKIWKIKLNENELEEICQKRAELAKLEIKRVENKTSEIVVESQSHIIVSPTSSST
ncbi:MAG: uridine kinase [Mycoplasmataceae bacterium CE_OT135]|nr:MAG: uridine kinase [Mycoplasmataceae bacterium CE_OT135]